MKKFAIATAVMTLLAACGGGGSSATGSGTAPTSNAAPTTPGTTPAPTQTIVTAPVAPASALHLTANGYTEGSSGQPDAVRTTCKPVDRCRTSGWRRHDQRQAEHARVRAGTGHHGHRHRHRIRQYLISAGRIGDQGRRHWRGGNDRLVLQTLIVGRPASHGKRHREVPFSF